MSERILDPIMFVDTNIFLDFYRNRNKGVSLASLKKIESITDRLIITEQIEMEYKKNRQVVIKEVIGQKYADMSTLTAPALISDMAAIKVIKKLQAQAKTQEKKVNERIEKILTNPTNNDVVYQGFQRIYKMTNTYKLTRQDGELWEVIYENAQKRFMLGYPPRKKDDTSFGDAINWEWIIKCAENSGKDIIIVTRDNDYGVTYNNIIHLNDWLDKEFKTRISRKRKIIITNSLSTALKMMKIRVPKSMEEADEQIIEEHQTDVIHWGESEYVGD